MADDSPRCEWVRDDIAAMTGAALREMKAKADHHIVHERKERSDTVYLVRHWLNAKDGEVQRMRMVAIAGLPTGHELAVNGYSTEDCLFEVKHALLDIYHLDRLPGESPRDTRNRVHRTSLVVNDA